MFNENMFGKDKNSFSEKFEGDEIKEISDESKIEKIKFILSNFKEKIEKILHSTNGKARKTLVISLIPLAIMIGAEANYVEAREKPQKGQQIEKTEKQLSSSFLDELLKELDLNLKLSLEDGDKRLIIDTEIAISEKIIEEERRLQRERRIPTLDQVFRGQRTDISNQAKERRDKITIQTIWDVTSGDVGAIVNLIKYSKCENIRFAARIIYGEIKEKEQIERRIPTLDQVFGGQKR